MRALVIAVLAAACARPVASTPTSGATTTAPVPTPASTTPASTTPASTTLAQLEASRDLDGQMVGASDAPATVVVVMASWCSACRAEIAMFDRLRAAHPHVRWLAVNYKQHEEYDRRGDSQAIRAFAQKVPWLRVVPADDALYSAVGRPSKIPTVLVFRGQKLVARFDRSERAAPDQDELADLLR
jgi:thiol-disulfide isomerase/thioredoxin